MKSKYLVAIFLLFLTGLLVLASAANRAGEAQYQVGPAAPNAEAAPGSCTIFTVSKDGRSYFGNTEDWINPNTYIWSKPAPWKGYGAVFFGFDNLYPQGGVNEMGLAYDWNSLPELPLNPHPELRGAPDKVGHHLLANNATVDEAIDWLSAYSWGSSFGAQMHLADATGDAAVMSAGPDGELTFTRKETGDGFLVSTNFNLAVPEAGGYPCDRYDRATSMLEQLMEEDRLAPGQIAAIMDATHQEGAEVNTVYANAIDLSRGILYLYHWYHFDEVFELDINSAIDRFVEPVPIRELFSQQTVDQATGDLEGYVQRAEMIQYMGTTWVWLLGVSLVVQIVLVTGKTGERWDERLGWIAGAAFIGPVAPLVRFINRRGAIAADGLIGSLPRWPGFIRAAIVRAALYTFSLLLTVPYFVAIGDEPRLLELLVATYLLPLLLGIFVYRGLPYARRFRGTYWAGLRQLTLTELTTHNLVFAAFVPSMLLLGDRWFASGINGDDPLVWLALGIGTFAGALLVLPLEIWLNRRGINTWPWRNVPGAETSPVKYLDLRSGWLVLLLSILLAVGLLLATTAQLP